MTEDLERIGRKLAPEVLRALADHLDHVGQPGQSEAVFHHGLGGRVVGMRTSVTTTVLDVRPPKGVASR